jgi:hypothetical protein
MSGAILPLPNACLRCGASLINKSICVALCRAARPATRGGGGAELVLCGVQQGTMSQPDASRRQAQVRQGDRDGPQHLVQLVSIRPLGIFQQWKQLSSSYGVSLCLRRGAAVCPSRRFDSNQTLPLQTGSCTSVEITRTQHRSSANAFCHSVRNLLSCCLLYARRLMYEIIILPIILYRCEIQYPTLQ